MRLLGEIAARSEPAPVADAERWYADAGALAATLGLRPLEARCRLGLGMLWARNGDTEAASREPAARLDPGPRVG